MILEYLKNPTSKQMVAEILLHIADFKYEMLPKLAFIAFCSEILHILIYTYTYIYIYIQNHI